MRVWAQSSHCSACPPRAAVRQLSMADMTLSWPRLTWPALALRHAGPWPRKISATSRIGRDTRAALRGRRARLALADELIERARYLPDRLGGHLGVERRGVELGVSEQDLDHPDV